MCVFGQPSSLEIDVSSRDPFDVHHWVEGNTRIAVECYFCHHEVHSLGRGASFLFITLVCFGILLLFLLDCCCIVLCNASAYD